MGPYSIYNYFKLKFNISERTNHVVDFIDKLKERGAHCVYQCIVEDDSTVETDYKFYIADNNVYIKVGYEFLSTFKYSKTFPWAIYRVDFSHICYYLTISDQRRDLRLQSLYVSECSRACLSTLYN